MPLRLPAGLIVATLTLGAPALAAAPPPTKPVDTSFFTGRWFEIARTVNANQKDCEAPTYDFTPTKGAPDFTLTCHKGSPGGPTKTLSVKVKFPKGEDVSRFKVSALGGVVNVEYVVLDHDLAAGWALMGTSGGNYMWLLSRNPRLDSAGRQAGVARARTLGYDVGKLVYPRF